jgi:hypothetical protein
MSSDRFPPHVAATLRSAGWSPTRRVDPEQWVERLTSKGTFAWSVAAEAALRDFGGLKVEQHGPGAECAREPFELDPLAGEGYEAEFGRVEHIVGESGLLPLGEAGGGQALLAIAASGAVYYLMESVGLLGHSIEEALARLIEGRKPLRVWDVDVTFPAS